jgi:pimeloyl-ACP methyl ester carboxylesterase
MAMALSTPLLFVCQTRAGLVFALGALSLGAAVFFAMLAWDRRAPKYWPLAAITLCGWLVATAWLLPRTPTGRAPTGAAVQHRYVGERDGFRRYALGNLLPEGDQLALGFRLMPALDPLFTREQASALSGLTAAIYAELEADPAFHALGSVMPEAYDELWRLPFDHGHYYLYVPPGLDRSAHAPVAVFLHGSGGNFKAYTWLLSKVADELGVVLIAPSYGMGNWSEPDTSRVVRAALDDAAKIVSLDPKNVHLIGLSNGGLGVSQAGRKLGDSLRSLAFISPVFDPGCIASQDFEQRWRGRPVLVISGAKDDRVEIEYVTDNVRTMTQAGVNVTFKVEDADHFMLFSHRARVIQTMIDWLRSQARTENKVPTRE